MSPGYSLPCFIPTPFLSNPSLSADGTWTTTYWPLHTPHKREILELNANFSRIVHGHRVKKCAFWKKFLPRLTSLGMSDCILYTCLHLIFMIPSLPWMHIGPLESHESRALQTYLYCIVVKYLRILSYCVAQTNKLTDPD